jgi:Peptidase A4 family
MESTRSAKHALSGRSRTAVAVPILVVVLVAVGLTLPTAAPAHQLWATAAGTVAQAQADSQVAAIQAVIQQANQEQAAALATNTPSQMSDTATAAYDRQLVQANQALLAQGATSINLIRLSWGPINVTGSTATATTSEAWTTTFNDGTTAESSATNVYTLVQQNGTWLIESDQQTPTASAQATPGAATQPAPQTPVPAVPAGQNTSHNWSGYAATSGTYTGVTGAWTVPVPGINGAPGVGATWVGIGGVNSHDLIQAGTQDVAGGNGQAQFQTWIEMLPQASQQVPVAVVPGDSVTVSINEQGAGSGAWQISITNNTTGQHYQTTVQYASSESSAEWIMEAPAASNGILPLDSFGSVSFTAASAIQNGQPVDIAQAGAQPITMLNANSQPLAVPSPIGGDGSSFTVARTAAPASTGTAGGPGQRPGRGRVPAGQAG